MGIGKRFDLQLDGKGFLLARVSGRRSWVRTGQSDSPSRRSPTDAEYGVLPGELDQPTVWDDWSEGYGYAYRRQGENGYHWSEGFDARYPRQLIHCQEPRMESTPNPVLANVETALNTGALFTVPHTGAGNTTFFGKLGFVTMAPTGSITSQLREHIDNPFGTVQWGPTLLHRPAIFGSFVYVGDVAGTRFWKIDTSGSPAAINSPGFRFTVAGNQLWRSHGPDVDHAHFLQHVADPAGVATLANWSATYNIGNRSLPIQDMISFKEQVYAGTPDGLYAGDQTGTFVNVLGELENQIHDDNCRDLAIYQDAVIAPHIAGLFAYRPDMLTARISDISPPRIDRSPVKGRIRAVRPFGRWLYAGLYTGSQSWILAADWGGQQPVWHTLQRLNGVTKISRLHVDTVTTASSGQKVPNHVWALTDASIDTGGTAAAFYWPITNMDGNPLAPDTGFSARYIGSARMDLGNIDGGAPGTPKCYRSFEIGADNLLSGSRYCDVYYDVDQSGSFTLLGRAQTSPKTTLYHSAGTGSWVNGQSIEYSIRSFTASPAITPVYRTFIARWALRPRSVDQISAVVRIADGLRDRQGGEMRSGATMLAELRALAIANTPTTLIDLTGAQSYVSVLPPVTEQEVYQHGDEYPQVAATIQMAVLTFS